MEVRTTKVHTHVLNVAVEGFAVRPTGSAKLSQTTAAGLAGPTGRPKTGRASGRTGRKSLREKALPPQSCNGPIRLRLTGSGFIQVSLNRS